MAVAMAAETASARGEQRCQGYQQHQAFDAGEHCAFVLRDLANLFGVGVGNCFLQLIRDRGYIRRAIPAVEQLRVHRFGIATGERVLRLGQRTYIKTADCAGLAQNLLGEREGGDDLIVLGRARGKNSDYAMNLTGNCDLDLPACDRAFVARLSPSKTSAKLSSGHAPCTFHQG